MLRVELPDSGEVRIENQRGDISIHVWEEQYVALSATIASSSSATRRASPVRVERSENYLSVSVQPQMQSSNTVRRRGAKPVSSVTAADVRVDLKVSLPARARAKIFTGGGAIEVRGMSATLAAQSVSGNIHLFLPVPLDSELSAHSLSGTVTIKNPPASGMAAETVFRNKYRTRLGEASRSVSLFSGRGQIVVATLAPADTVASLTAPAPRNTNQVGSPEVTSSNPSTVADVRERRPPTLIGSGSSSAAGASATPAAVVAPDSPEEVDEDEVVRVETELVTLNVSVIERASGRGLLGLGQSDFKLFEDGAEQQIAHFESSSAPFDLMLLIDLSGSTSRVTNLIRAAALKFIAAARPQDRIGIITFAGATNVVSSPTTDRALLRERIGAMQPPQGDTRLYDALAFTMEELARAGSASRRQAIVLLSDGLDSTLPNVTGVGSTLTYEDLRSRVREFDGVLYTIWTSTEDEAFSPLDIQPETFDTAHDRMAELADAGGGLFYDVERLEDLAGAYERVVADLGTLYGLSYRPTNKARDGRWRTIRVTLPEHADAVARGKRGYYAR